MGFAKGMSLVLMVCCLGAQDLPPDPVMKARSERARSQGLREADLPAVPRAVLEPPPLPPPETNHKDTRAGRLAAAQRKRKHPAKGGRRHAGAGAPSTPRTARTGKPAGPPSKGAAKRRKKRKV